MFKNKIIFVAPLDWGLGHATRCVPLIKCLMADNTVILGVTKSTALIFDEEFPELQKEGIEPYDITYSRRVPLMLKLLFSIPRLLQVIKKEQQQLVQIIKTHQVDVVISDSRLGLHTRYAETIYITHQLNIQAGWFSLVANRVHHGYIKKYHTVWVPDFKAKEDALAGKLSRHAAFQNATYLGSLSRLDRNIAINRTTDYLILLSGPEPQRSILENKLLKQLPKTTKRMVIVRGTTKAPEGSWPLSAERIDLPSASDLSQLIQSAGTIICRSGYSTLMDLHNFRKQNLILIPTPSQPEQIYLALYWKKKFNAQCLLQDQLHHLTWL